MLVKERLISARDKKGLSQTAMAKKLGIAQSFYCRIENCKKKCPLDLVADIADILEVSVDYLLGRE